MKILSIETSCDETSAAVIENGQKILSSALASSQNIHKKTGGIIPENAARKQIESIIPIINEALLQAFPHPKLKTQKLLQDNIDAIAVTVGPGLIGSLLVGVESAKTIAFMNQKPLIPVNHLLGHVYANWLNKNKKPKLPAVVLVVSGGHTDLIYIKSHGKIKWLGGTRDDAAGEAFDKIAKLLSLPYPGGPAISKRAQKYLSKNPNAKLNLFPRPMINEDNFDFSFSGLKTSVKRYLEKQKNQTAIEIDKISAEAQEAICEVLATKALKAVKKLSAKGLILGGGVAANYRLRELLVEKIKLENMGTLLHVPVPSLCTDNAEAIGAAAFYNNQKINIFQVNTNPNLKITDIPSK